MRLVMCTCPPAEAPALARGVIEASLAACVQVIPAIQSVYRWEGEICEDTESLLLCKTTKDAVDALTQHLINAHSYDVPEVVSLEIASDEGNPAYHAWLFSQVRQGQ